MTKALAEALEKACPARGATVLVGDKGGIADKHEIRRWLRAAQRAAGVRLSEGPHVLRHTFCSHLAMRGAPAKAIQELAGHSNLTTTYRYMHLSPAAREGAIRLLDRRDDGAGFGEMLETPHAAE